MIPAWHPTQPLKARELLRWEEYLLSRAQFAGCDPGLESTTKDSITHRDHQLCVQELTGLTPAGCPVVIGGMEEALAAPIPQGPQHVFVEVHTKRTLSDSMTTPAAGQHPQKYRLVFEAGAPSLPLTCRQFPDRLYLGCWQLADTNLRLLCKPKPRCLAALQPLLGHAEWSEWIEPFESWLHRNWAAQQHSTAHIGGVLLGNAFARLLTGGAHFPLGELWREMAMIPRLARLVEGQRLGLLGDGSQQNSSPPDTWGANELPSGLVLAAGYDSPSEITLMEGQHYEVSKAKNFGPSYRILKFLGTGPQPRQIRITAPEYPKIGCQVLMPGKVPESYYEAGYHWIHIAPEYSAFTTKGFDWLLTNLPEDFPTTDLIIYG